MMVYCLKDIKIYDFSNDRSNVKYRKSISYELSDDVFQFERISSSYYIGAYKDKKIILYMENSASQDLVQLKVLDISEVVIQNFKFKMYPKQKLGVISYENTIQYFKYSLSPISSSISLQSKVNTGERIGGIQIVDISSYGSFIILAISNNGRMRSYFINPFSKKIETFIDLISLDFTESQQIFIKQEQKQIICIDENCTISYFTIKVK